MLPNQHNIFGMRDAIKLFGSFRGISVKRKRKFFAGEMFVVLQRFSGADWFSVLWPSFRGDLMISGCLPRQIFKKKMFGYTYFQIEREITICALVRKDYCLPSPCKYLEKFCNYITGV